MTCDCDAAAPPTPDAAQLARWRAALLSTTAGARANKLTTRTLAVFLAVRQHTTPPSVRHIAEQLVVRKPAVVRALDALEELGLLSRKRPDADRRSVMITLTAKGEDLAKRAELPSSVGHGRHDG